MMDDFYCDEVFSGRTNVAVMYETGNVLAFHHTRPSYAVHVVVVPKRHVVSLLSDDLDDPLLMELLAAVKHVARTIEEENGACRVITNLGRYQDSKHLHFHVVFGPKT